MKHERPQSLQSRLLLLVLAVVSAVWLLSAASTWWDARHELDELLDGHLAQAAALLVLQQARELQEGEEADERGVDAPSLHRYAPKVAFQVFHEGRLSLRSANAPLQAMAPTGAGFSTVQIDGVAWRVFSSQGAEQDVQVHVGEQRASRDAILWAVLRSSLWPSLLALPLLALAVAWAVLRSLRPLRRLGVSLAQRRPDDLQAFEAGESPLPQEVQSLLDALNGLLQRIAHLMAAERRFTADAAHELRTPIAAIRAQAQVALAEADDGARRHALQATLAGCDRAQRLVEQLLTLSRLESGEPPAFERLDFSALLRDSMAELALAALQKEQDLTLDAPPGLSLQGNAVLLGVLVRNLVDNAIRYSPAGARVQVQLAAEGEGLRLIVQDSGPGLAEAELARLGERFYRPLGSDAPGSGLGWSIVRRIAALHGARVAVQRSAGCGGLEVTLDFPGLPASRILN